jgi:hypothetical protein
VGFDKDFSGHCCGPCRQLLGEEARIILEIATQQPDIDPSAVTGRCIMNNKPRSDSRDLFRITFLNKGQVYEVYVREVYQSDLYGFIEIENFVFGERTQMVVDPGEEKLKGEFAGVKRSFIPIQAIIRIDEVEKEGVASISKGDNIAAFPIQFVPRGNTNSQPD